MEIKRKRAPKIYSRKKRFYNFSDFISKLSKKSDLIFQSYMDNNAEFIANDSQKQRQLKFELKIKFGRKVAQSKEKAPNGFFSNRLYKIEPDKKLKEIKKQAEKIEKVQKRIFISRFDDFDSE